MVRVIAAGLLLLGTTSAVAQEAGQRVLLLDASLPGVDPAARRVALQAVGAALERDPGWRVLTTPDAEAQLREKIAPLLAQARTESEAFRERRALELLDQAEALYRSSLGPAASIEPLREVLLFRARLVVDLGDRQKLQQVLSRLEVIDPERNLDAGSFPPAVVRLKRSLRRRLRPGTLQVASVPAGLGVWVDGVHRGQAPLTLQLLSGEHFVVASGRGQSVARAVTVQAEKPAELSLELGEPRQSWVEAARRGRASRVVALTLAAAGSGLQLRLELLPVAGSGPAAGLTSPLMQESGVRAGAGELAGQLALRLRPPAVAVAPQPSSNLDSTTSGAARSRERAARPWWRTWWFWTAVAVVAGGAAVGTAVGVTSSRDEHVRLFIER